MSPPFVSVVVAVAASPGVTTGGAVSVREWPTTIGVVPLTPSTVTLIVATPSPTALTRPAALTVATFVSLLLYPTVLPDRSAKDWSLFAASTTLSAATCCWPVSSWIQRFLPVRSTVSPAL